jgi:catechol 2,3-dioxygenase-like lactoylglutathione lyase family enzyme
MKFTHTAQVAFQIIDMAAALRFYCEGLGLKQKFTMSYQDAYTVIKEQAEKAGPLSDQTKRILSFFASRISLPWIVFLETGEHQFLELFYTYDEKQPVASKPTSCGFQHLCLEVDDIQAMLARVKGYGIEPDSAIERGPDRSWQFWLHDPDGNRIVLKQYAFQEVVGHENCPE